MAKGEAGQTELINVHKVRDRYPALGSIPADRKTLRHKGIHKNSGLHCRWKSFLAVRLKSPVPSPVHRLRPFLNDVTQDVQSGELLVGSNIHRDWRVGYLHVNDKGDLN